MKKVLYEKFFENIPDTKKITNLRNTEKGACYIFGDGKSLKYYNLSSFSDLPSISLGLVSLHFGSEFLNLKYSLNCDSFSLFPGKNIYDYYIRFKSFIKSKQYSRALGYISPFELFKMYYYYSSSKLLFNDNDVLLNSNFITHCTNYYFTKFLDKSLYFNHNLKLNDKIDNDLNKNSFNFYAGSLHFSIYFAYYLGFQKIYLIGCDYQDIEPTGEHWWEKGKPIPYSGKQANSYIEFMRKFIEIKIITRNKSYGDNFISYKDFSGNDLEYKENYQIISSKKLALLKRQGIYTI